MVKGVLEEAPQGLGPCLPMSELGVDLLGGDGKRRQALAGSSALSKGQAASKKRLRAR